MFLILTIIAIINLKEFLMEYAKLDRIIKSIGKSCLIDCYEIAITKGDNLTINDLIQYHPKLKELKISGNNTRLSKIKKLYRERLLELGMSRVK